LNKQYRLLSKTKDDLELLSRRPDLMMDPEDITRRITELMDSVAEVSERRLAQLKKNRVLDEVAFMFDSIPMLMSRNIPEREESKDEGEGEGDGEDGMPHGRLTRRQLHKAKMTEELVTDTDLELFEGGYGSMETASAKEPTVRFGSAGDIPLNTDDPLLRMIVDRVGPVSYISSVKGRERDRRIFLAMIGFMETLTRTNLTNRELLICAKEFEELVPKKADSRSILQRGVATFCAMIGTRLEDMVLIPKTEGVTPPPTTKQLPSYRIPFEKEDPNDTFMRFIVNVLRNVSKREIKDTKAVTTFSFILKYVSKLNLSGGKDDPDGKKSIELLRDTIHRCVSPSMVARVIRTQTVLSRTKMDNFLQQSLKLVKRWEHIPITHNPHPDSQIMVSTKQLLEEEPVLFMDSYGRPYPNNSIYPATLRHSSIPEILSKIHNIRSEKVQELLYESKIPTMKHASLVLVTPAPEFIGVKRPRIEGGPLVREEVPIRKVIAPDVTPEHWSTKEHIPEIHENLQKLFKQILNEGEIGHLARDDDTPFRNLTQPLRGSTDIHGAMRGGQIVFNDVLIMALEKHQRELRSIPEPVPCEKALYPGEYRQYQAGSTNLPIYTARRVISKLLSGIPPMQIEYSKTEYPTQGGTRNTVLTGRNTYFERVLLIEKLLPEMGITTIQRNQVLQMLCRNILLSLLVEPSKLEIEDVLGILMVHLKAMIETGTEDALAACEAYITLIGHKSGFYRDILELNHQYTDVDEAILSEELNHDREKERQRFIYQLEGLDPEQRKLARSARALGIDLAGKVANDPRKFNSEYYEIQTQMVIDQRIEEQYHAPEERTQAYGDADDVAFDRMAEDGAYTEVAQIADLDYDE
jgi:hypothetical protein